MRIEWNITDAYRVGAWDFELNMYKCNHYHLARNSKYKIDFEGSQANKHAWSLFEVPKNFKL